VTGPPFSPKTARAWYFVAVPTEHAPVVAGAWGRAPVRATVDGASWDTSCWRDRRHGWLLAIPRAVRGDKGDGDEVSVVIAPR
jgi:hypothetical protein